MLGDLARKGGIGPGKGPVRGEKVIGVSSGSGRNDTLSAIGANHAAIASRTPKAFITRSSVSSVGLPLSLNAL